MELNPPAGYLKTFKACTKQVHSKFPSLYWKGWSLLGISTRGGLIWKVITDTRLKQLLLQMPRVTEIKKIETRYPQSCKKERKKYECNKECLEMDFALKAQKAVDMRKVMVQCIHNIVVLY